MTPMNDEIRFQMFLAKLFGRKGKFVDSGFEVTVYVWRGIAYVIDVVELPKKM